MSSSGTMLNLIIMKLKKKFKKFGNFELVELFKEIILTLTLNHYFDSIYLILSSKSSILDNRHVSTIYVLKLKNAPNLRYATRFTKIIFGLKFRGITELFSEEIGINI